MAEEWNENRVRKKLGIPVIALILLAVCLTGTAYAYSSSISVSDNTTGTPEYLVIDLRNCSASDIVSIPDNGALVFTDNYRYPDNSDRLNRVDAAVTTTKIIVCNLKVSSDAEWNTIKVTSSDIATFLGRSVDGVPFGDAFRVYVNVNDDSMTGAMELKAAGTGEASFPVAKVNETDNVTVYVYLVAMDNGTPLTTLGAEHATTVRAESAVAAQNDHDSVYYRNLFSTEDYLFTLTFQATYVAPATP